MLSKFLYLGMKILNPSDMYVAKKSDRYNALHIAAWCTLAVLMLLFLLSLLDNNRSLWLRHPAIKISVILMCGILIWEKINSRDKAKSPSRIRAFFNHAPCGFHSLDANGVIIAINQTELDWLGYTYEEVTNKMNFTDLITKGSLAIFKENYPQFKKVGFINELNFDLIAKDGSLRPVLISSVAHYDSKGNYHHSQSTVFDISQHKKLEEELLAAKETAEMATARFRELYDQAPCGYHSSNAEGTIIEINQTFLDWLGYSYEEVVGKINVFDLLDEDIRDKFRSRRNENVKKGSMHELYFDMIRKDGTRFSVLLSGTAVFDEHGNFKYTLAASFDYSHRNKLEEELIAINETATIARISQEHFLANMSHEIRTPMNAIIGFTGILEKTELNARQKHYVNSIQTASETLMSILNDILDFSKMEAGMFNIETVLFDLQGLLHSIDEMMQMQAAQKQLQLDIHYAANLPDQLLGDPTRLTQILINLIGNALKFTEQGSISVRIEVIERSAKTTTVQFSVKDTGIGISEAQLVRIFERFEQGEKSTARLYGGTGLGLSICKRLVDLQGGSIHVTSELGVGSEFVFTLPYQLPLVEIAEPGFDKVDNSAEPPVPSTNGYGSRILIAEDNLMNRILIRFLMEEWNFEYDFAENGEIALEKLRNKHFDLVLMDIQMPVMDGYQTTQIIRNELQLTLPIIAMTAHAFSGEREKCLIAGMNDYITKPLRQAELSALLLKYMEQYEND
jgi:PAS domain S-box-containing protein